MKLSEAIELHVIQAGGPGSGCNPEKGKCGRPSEDKSDDSAAQDTKTVAWKPTEKPVKEKGAYHPDFGKANSKKVLGIWVATSTMAHLYKELMTGDWKKVSDLKASTQAKGLEAKVEQRLQGLNRVGRKLGNYWTLEYKNGKSEVRMVMHKDTSGEKGNVKQGTMDDLQKAALKAVQQLIGGKGLEHTFSAQMLKAFMDEVGIGKTHRIEGAMASWRGSSNSQGAAFMRKVAADYYGRQFNNNTEHGIESYMGKVSKNDFDYENLQKQMLAVKALSTEYVRTAGIKTLYRGIGGALGSKIAKAINAGQAVEVPINALSSFSVSKHTADGFSGADSTVIKIDIDPEDVWVASGAVGHLFGSFTTAEKEYVVGSRTQKILLTPENVRTNHNVPSWWKDKK